MTAVRWICVHSAACSQARAAQAIRKGKVITRGWGRVDLQACSEKDRVAGGWRRCGTKPKVGEKVQMENREVLTQMLKTRIVDFIVIPLFFPRAFTYSFVQTSWKFFFHPSMKAQMASSWLPVEICTSENDTFDCLDPKDIKAVKIHLP